MHVGRKLRLAMTIGAAASTLSIGLVATSISGAGASAPKGTIVFAEAPTATPDYIFPYVSGHFFSVANLTQFQELMYRPLYWFGLGKSISLQPQLSLAASPVYSNGNKTVTLNLKGWKFANGQTVNAQSVMFFLNMYKADPAGYAGYVPN
jgi:peptide/nickel transport system substrate-binding protein